MTRIRGPCRILAAAGLLFLLSACGAAPEPPLRISVSEWPGYAPWLDARDAGRIDGRSVRVVAFDSPQQSVHMLRNRMLEGAAMTLDMALRVTAVEPDYRVVLVTNISDGGDAIVARAGIGSVRDLAGRRVLVDRDGYGSLLLDQALKDAGLDGQAVERIYMTRMQREMAFRRGEGDAVVTEEPARTALLGQGGVEIYSSRAAPGLIVDVLLVRAALVESRCEDLREFVRAWAAFVPWHGGSAQGLRFVDMNENRALLGPERGLERSAARLRELMRLPPAADGTPLGTADCLPEVH